MEVFYDQVIEAEATSKLLGIPNVKVRLASLQGEGSVVGMVGLLEIRTPPLKPRQDIRRDSTIPDLILHMETNDTRESKASVEASNIVITHETEDGFSFYDPNDVLVTMRNNESVSKISPVRQTTVVVNDIEHSIQLYRDGLGLEVFSDYKITDANEAKLLGMPEGSSARMVRLRGDDNEVGTVGLLFYESSPIQPPRSATDQAPGPDVALIFMTDDITSDYDKLCQNGAKTQCPPIEYEIPGRGIATGLSCYDPNGVLIEYTQFGPISK
jgi:catechol 2,3-dioxygenase-like lactoylglutathione lyase family enzyme